MQEVRPTAVKEHPKGHLKAHEPRFALPADELASLFTAAQLDVAVDRAARASRSTVAVFMAAPGEGAALEFAIEFFVEPTTIEAFRLELEIHLRRLSKAYAAGRRRGEFWPALLHVLPAGAFHQWRCAWRITADAQRENRWPAAPTMLNTLLRQARTGWRESAC